MTARVALCRKCKDTRENIIAFLARRNDNVAMSDGMHADRESSLAVAQSDRESSLAVAHSGKTTDLKIKTGKEGLY